jgi:hypothetical protein
MDEFFIEKIQHSEINNDADILTDAFKTNPAYSIDFEHWCKRNGNYIRINPKV